MRLSWYAARLKTGACDPLGRPELVIDSSALALIDGHDAMGPIVAAMAADEAIRRAKAYGIGAVGARNSNHFGTAMYFTLMAARARRRDYCGCTIGSSPLSVIACVERGEAR